MFFLFSKYLELQLILKIKHLVVTIVSQANEFIRISLLCFIVHCHQTVSNVDTNCAALSV